MVEQFVQEHMNRGDIDMTLTEQMRQVCEQRLELPFDHFKIKFEHCLADIIVKWSYELLPLIVFETRSNKAMSSKGQGRTYFIQKQT